MGLLKSLSTTDPNALVLGAAMSLVGIAIAHLSGRRRWEDDYDELARGQRMAFWFVYGRPLAGVVLVLILCGGMAVHFLMTAEDPSDPWHRNIRPRGWGCIVKTGDVVGCSRAAAAHPAPY
jgi:hypothetical protein